ncbi:polo-like kinase 3 [Linnemannia exigua]|uniref:Polo-like kinase 3 n=1 Tax=Linnemannia exigua TaxID=604196 RepID=A0AAD4DEI7_9FUNG|nr:polo-like kinase 3 [Linnemannia exigua]
MSSSSNSPIQRGSATDTTTSSNNTDVYKYIRDDDGDRSEEKCGCSYRFSDRVTSNSHSNDRRPVSVANNDTQNKRPQIDPYFMRTVVDEMMENKYTQEKLLGMGSFGYVHRVVDEDGKRFAMKSFKMHKLTDADVQRVIQALAKTFSNLHRNVVAILRGFETPESRTMRGLLQERDQGRLREPEVQFFGRQLAAGLNHLHSIGLAHYDVKLDNLLLTDKMGLKIGDMGLAEHVFECDYIGTPGTVGYRAPEMFRGRIHTTAVDIWSAGIVLLKMVLGYQVTFTGTEDIIHNARLSWGIRDLLWRMLGENPETRYTAQNMLDHEFLKSRGRMTWATRNILAETRPISAYIHIAPDCTKKCARLEGNEQAEVGRLAEEKAFEVEMAQLRREEERHQEELQKALWNY